MELTKREEQVMSLLAMGMDTDEVARCMGISTRTVTTFLTKIHLKLGVSSRCQAVSAFMLVSRNDTLTKV